MPKSRKTLVKEALEEIQQEAQLAPLLVALFGGGGSRLQKRRQIAEKLSREGFTALVPEDDFPPGSLSTYEVAYLRTESIDIAFIYPESLGSATEFGQFLDDDIIAHKLMVLVPHRYHPIYGDRGGYLSDAYMRHLAKYGHVYGFDESGQSPFPKSYDIILKICQTRRDLKIIA
jgi:hypothetical protein